MNAHEPNSRLDEQVYQLWIDGQLSPEEARAAAAAVASDPDWSARHAQDLAISASLRRSFAPIARAPRVLHALPRGGASRPWLRHAAAAGLLAAFAVSAVAVWRSGPRAPTGADELALQGRVPQDRELAAAGREPDRVAMEIGDVYLDALAGNFQPLIDCRMQSAWDADLFAQLARTPCNREAALQVLGEWVDPRLAVDNLVMLRRGDDPILLVVPPCDLRADFRVPEDSGYFVHRGVRDGREIFEISPAPSSQVLTCVDADSVVTVASAR